MIHKKPFELAGKTVKLKTTVKHRQFPNIGGSDFKIEDWQDRVIGKSWMDYEGNPACIVYGLRALDNNLPIDNEVLYGHTLDGIGHLIHISEIDFKQTGVS